MNFERALQEYQRYLLSEYQKKNTRRNYYRFTTEALKWLKEDRAISDTNEITKEHAVDWKAHCQEKYVVNGNVNRINAWNNFVDKFLGRKELRVGAPKSRKSNKQVMSEEELNRYMEAAETPLEHLITVLQVDGLLRPTEMCEIKISNIDFENRKLYLDDTKTGNNYIMMSPRMVESLKGYLEKRMKPLKDEDKDRLIIIPKGSHRGLAPQKGRGDFVYNTTKRIAARAGFTRSIYPYLIKPSVITNDLNNRVNPRIVQRKARHKNIETTLLYDHSDDKMVLDHFDRQQKVEVQIPQTEKEIAEDLLEKCLNGKISPEAFEKKLELLVPEREIEAENRKKKIYDVAYS